MREAAIVFRCSAIGFELDPHLSDETINFDAKFGTRLRRTEPELIHNPSILASSTICTPHALQHFTSGMERGKRYLSRDVTWRRVGAQPHRLIHGGARTRHCEAQRGEHESSPTHSRHDATDQ